MASEPPHCLQAACVKAAVATTVKSRRKRVAPPKAHRQHGLPNTAQKPFGLLTLIIYTSPYTIPFH